MADEKDEAPQGARAEGVPGRLHVQHVEAVPAPPLLFVDDVGTLGHYNGIVHLSLDQLRFEPTPEGHLRAERMAVAHLRMNVVAAQGLRNALDKALLMAVPVSKGPAN